MLSYDVSCSLHRYLLQLSHRRSLQLSGESQNQRQISCYYIHCVQSCMNNHVYRTPFSNIERKKEVAKSKERRKEIHNFINY